jgi:type IV pilus assembly protein PilM
MIRLSRSQPQPIGLDIGLDSIKMLQLEVVQGGALSVVAAARHVVPEEARNQQPDVRLGTAMQAVRQMLRANSFRGNRVIACLPREIVHVKNLRLPMMPSAEIESAVQFEARNIFSFDTERAMVRHLVGGEVRQGADTRLEVIALAAMRDEVDAYVEQLHGGNCLIESLDFEQCAIYRGVERFVRRREDEGEVHVLVEIGARRTQVIIGKGREISFVKSIETGSMHLQQDVSRKLGITADEARALRRRLIEQGIDGAAGGQPDSVRQAVYDAIRSSIEELAREISLCLRYYSVTFRGQRPSKARLLGGESADDQLLSILGGALPIKIEAGKPLYSVDTSRMKQSDRRGNMGEWSLALGLALKLTNEHFGARDGRKRSEAAREAAMAAEAEPIDISPQASERALPSAREAANA